MIQITPLVMRQQGNKINRNCSLENVKFRVERTLDLYNKGNKKDERMSGSIKILIGKQEKRNEKVLFLF